MNTIEVGQKWIGLKNEIVFTIVKVTEKSVSVIYTMQNEEYSRQKKGILTKKQLIECMKLKENG